MSISSRIIIFFAKLLGVFSRVSGLGAGATWPGEIALRMRKSLLSEFATFRVTIVLVSGTNGKTTTVKMIETILKTAGRKVRSSPSGANLDNGIASGFIEDASWLGDLTSEIFVFEADEATLAKVAPVLNPRIIVLLNLFRDQLDRYGEVDAVAEQWIYSFKRLDTRTHMLFNGDDPHLVFIGSNISSRVSYFGLDEPALFLPKMQHATDSIYCPKCGSRLTFGGMYFSHLGKWACGRCGLTHPDLIVAARDFTSPLLGVYNIYNTLAAASVTKILGLIPGEIQKGLQMFTPAFGRLEELNFHGKQIKILLSKNPTGFNESIRTAVSSNNQGPPLLILNDRIPDGRDVSWIWDVDFELLESNDANEKSKSRRMFVSGDRCYDLALRLKYAGVSTDRISIHNNLFDAVEKATEETLEKEILWVMPTYSAMLDVRGLLAGRKID